MVERKEVEALLDAVKGSEHYAPLVRPQTLAALCRAWLAVDGAASGKVMAVGEDIDTGIPRIIIHSSRDDIGRGPSIAFQRVRIVKEASDG